MKEKLKKNKWWVVLGVLLFLFIITPTDETTETQTEATTTEQATTEKATTEEVTEATMEKEEKPEFRMLSDDTIGASKHTLVGVDSTEPSGKYRIVCTSGHGSLTINDADLHFFANDDYVGQEQSGLVFEKEVTIELNGSDKLLARNFNSSDFKIEFYVVE